MLNISENSSLASIDKSQYRSFKFVDRLALSRVFGKWVALIISFLFLCLFLPWTQNIQSKGSITSLDPAKRPQTIHATIPGRIEKWYVSEGDRVKAGDTIVYISEVKAEYFDTLLIERTQQKINAKDSAISSYEDKVEALSKTIEALRAEQLVKIKQLENKIQQAQLDYETYKGNLIAAKNDYDIAQNRLKRYDTLNREGVVSDNSLESYLLKIRQAEAKLTKARNEVDLADRKLDIAKLDLLNQENYYAEKIAKAQSDRASAYSSKYDAEGTIAELRNTLSNYQRRSEFYYITAPQDSYITKAIKPGIGEIIKEGEPLVSIMPQQFKLAAEIYVEPLNLPLVKKGQPVSLLFDGWPTVVFSGWPNLSYGTFYGEVFAIDNFTNDKGKYRVLVAQTKEDNKEWPDALRPGSGAQALVFLNDVPIWYELWRLLNGFPPDYYQMVAEEEQYNVSSTKKSEKK
ncbi:MAG: biotin/lipoyl-binding protein [Candidatus Kapaibacteriales bacterium]